MRFRSFMGFSGGFGSGVKEFPDAVVFGEAPGLGVAAARLVGPVAVEDLRHVHDAAVVELDRHGRQQAGRGGASECPVRHVVRLGEERHLPRPRGAVVVGRLAPRVRPPSGTKGPRHIPS